ncbi:unnamed protein product [Urochloa decumbens]|uniref:F-box domain-containing protein n=1 Tax=Urochloa decumbens TaxID=240449 RepID=A0ABC9F5X6_9POAL
MSSQVQILRRGIPVASGVGLLQHCTNVAIRPLNDAMDFSAKKNLDMNKQDERVLRTCKRRGRRQSLPVVSEELIFEILVRLPVQTLMRFKSVCKAWHAIISDPFFIRMHLQQSTHRHKGPCFLITPHSLDKVIDDEAWPTTFSNSISLYLWQEGQKDASLMHSTDFHGEFGTVYPMSHCDGLVMIPTDTKVYVLNPAIGDVLKLPDGHKDEGSFHSVGLGLDRRTFKYKVVRSFYRSVDYSKRTYDVGMEVFTLGGDDIDSTWRSTVNDPPYPIQSQVPKYFEGSVYWDICEDLLENPPHGFLKFSLEDETFSFICYPCGQSKGDNEFMLTELGGQLCLAQRFPTQIVIWVLPSGGSHRWVRLYVINLLEAWTLEPLLGTLKDGILVRRGNYLYRYDGILRQAREVVCAHQVTYKNPKEGSIYEVKDVFYFNIIPYVESLVRVTRARSPSGSSAPRV